MNGPPAAGFLATLTHARLRAEQGDLPEARRIALAILAADPAHAEARSFLAALEDVVGSMREEREDEALPPPRAGDARSLAAGFRRVLRGGESTRERAVERLEAWAAVVTRNRGRTRAR